MSRKILLRFSCLLLAVLMLAMTLTGCSASRKVRANARAGRVIGTAGDMDILYENLYYLAMNKIDRMLDEDENAFDDPAAYEELEAFVQENLVSTNDAILSLGRSYGFDWEKGEIAATVQERMDGILENVFDNDRGDYIDSLKAEYLTDRYIRSYLAATEVLPDLIIDKLLTEGVIDDSDEKAWEIIRDDEKFIRVVQIEIYAYNFGGYDAAKARAEELRERVASKTDDVARQREWWEIWKLGTQAETTGNGFYYAKGQIKADYEQALFDLPNYGVSEVIPITGGYAILMRFEKDYGGYVTENFESLKRKTYHIELNRQVEQRRAEMPLELNSFGESLDLLNLPAVNAGGGEWLFPFFTVLGIVLVVGGGLVFFTLYQRKKGSKKRKK